MEVLTDFLVSNYLWFLVTSIVLVFALIGYFVDQNEQKKGLSSIHKREPELNIQDLALIAQNKSLNNAVSDAMRDSNLLNATPMQSLSNGMQAPIQNQSTNVIQNVSQNNQVVNSSMPVGFDVLTK